ncbi:MAG: ABC transporter ATP-binding protein [Chloroflexota bacterium]
MLEVRDLSIEIASRRHPIRVVDGVSLSVGRGEVVGLVGESGCGKSMTGFGIAGVFPTAAARVAGGSVVLNGQDLTRLDPRARRAKLGEAIGVVFQDPSTFLDPLMRVGDQVAESLRVHGQARGAERQAIDLLAQMDLPDPAGLARRYPHELSGGQRQRVMIAAALAMRPTLLIADEPTTALDVTVQASILRLLLDLRTTLGLAVLLITHDLGVVAQTCDRVYVMYAGHIVEANDTRALFRGPRHPYTRGLLQGTLAIGSRSAGGPGSDLFSMPGTVPDPRGMPTGCRFHPRCPLRADICVAQDPPLMHRPQTTGCDACWRALDLEAPQVWDMALASDD